MCRSRGCRRPRLMWSSGRSAPAARRRPRTRGPPARRPRVPRAWTRSRGRPGSRSGASCAPRDPRAHRADRRAGHRRRPGRRRGSSAAWRARRPGVTAKGRSRSKQSSAWARPRRTDQAHQSGSCSTTCGKASAILPGDERLGVLEAHVQRAGLAPEAPRLAPGLAAGRIRDHDRHRQARVLHDQGGRVVGLVRRLHHVAGEVAAHGVRAARTRRGRCPRRACRCPRAHRRRHGPSCPSRCPAGACAAARCRRRPGAPGSGRPMKPSESSSPTRSWTGRKRWLRATKKRFARRPRRRPACRPPRPACWRWACR